MYEDTCSTISGGERLAEPRECPLFCLGRPLQEASRAPPQQHEHRFLREVLLPRLFHSRRRVQVRRDDHLRYAENVSVIADNRVIREYNDAHRMLEIGYKDCANQARKLSRLEPMALIFSGWKVEERKASLRNSCSPYFPYFRAPKRIVGSTVVDR